MEELKKNESGFVISGGTIIPTQIPLKMDNPINQCYGVSSCTDSEKREVYLLGGFDDEGEGSLNFHKLNLFTNQVTRLPDSLEGRLFGSVCLKTSENGDFELVVYSGLDNLGSGFCGTFSIFRGLSDSSSSGSWERINLEDFEGFSSLENKSSTSMSSKFMKFPSYNDKEELPVFIGWNEDLENRDNVMGDALHIIIFDISQKRIHFRSLPPLESERGYNFGSMVGDKYFYCLKNKSNPKQQTRDQYNEEPLSFPTPTLIRCNVLDEYPQWETLEVQGEENPNTYLSTFTTLNNHTLVCFGGTDSKGRTYNVYDDMNKVNLHILNTQTMMWKVYLAHAQDFPIVRFGYAHFCQSSEKKLYVMNGIYTLLDDNTVFDDLVCFDLSEIVEDENYVEDKDTISRMQFLVSEVQEGDEEDHVYGKKIKLVLVNNEILSYSLLLSEK